MRLFLILLALAVVFLIPLFCWGDIFDAALSGERAVAWLRSFGSWGWAAAIFLLLMDLFLPVPSTAVLAALGLIYGTVLGGLIGSVGACLAGAVAFFACRLLGRSTAQRIAGKKGLARGERLFGSVGGWLVALSRCLPLVAEVVACMAGLARMPTRTFLVALVSGSLPMAFTFAAVGHAGQERPALSLALSALLPLVVWPVAQYFLMRKKKQGGAS